MNAFRHKEKTYHAITYFLHNTRNCYKKKLYKLLFLLDFEFYEISGRPVTHLDYFAWKMGPVPSELQVSIDNGDDDLISYFEIRTEHLGEGYEATALHNRADFDARYFSVKEFEIMKRLADTWADATAKDLEDYTHREGRPWHRAWEVEGRRQQLIPLDYALDYLDEGERNSIRQVAVERSAFVDYDQ